MEAKKRPLKSGKEYDHLFPSPSDQDITIKKSGDVEDTMKLIQRTVPQTQWHTEKIARKLKGKTLDETCSNIWHFVYGHVQYKRDKDGVEQVRSPRRTWWERETGVDCDCYTEFISSILCNLRIPHKARITKYPKKSPEVPRWQHVYPIVPRNENAELNDRDDYIVLDCVKDNYDEEQPFLECKDYDMQLDYLDGIEDEQQEEELTLNDVVYDTVDAEEMADLYGDLGFLKKLRAGIKKVAKKVGDAVGKGVRFLNRFTNPATILLRNGFLLAMKVNLLNVAGKLRYAYLTDAKAKELGMNLDSLNKLRKVKDRAETVYWQAGGKKENLKKAILKGKGNKDKKVPMNGLFGLDDVYADPDEYRIIHSDLNELGDLGDPATGTAIAAATSAVAAIAAALKQVKGLFNKGGKEEASFQSETDNAGNAASSEATLTQEEQIIQEEYDTSSANLTTSDGAALPASASASRRIDSSVATQTQSTALQTTTDQNAGFVQKTTTWIKANPGKSILIAGATVAGGIVLAKVLGSSNKQGNAVNGVPQKTKKKGKSKPKKETVATIKL
jgi:hypothetical protein